MTRPRSAGRVEADAVEPVAERAGDPQRLLCLVLNVSTSTMRGTSGCDVPIERLGGPHRVADDEHERVRHRARRREAGEAGAGRRRGAHAAADDGGVVERVGDVRMDVARAEADDRLGAAAASTHSRAAVAQPVDCASMPRMAVS